MSSQDWMTLSRAERLDEQHLSTLSVTALSEYRRLMLRVLQEALSRALPAGEPDGRPSGSQRRLQRAPHRCLIGYADER